jgi:hypothetical protein
MNSKGKDIYMYILGAIIVIGSFIIVGMMIYHEVPAGSKDTINIAIGILLASAGSVVGYFYGSSKSSADKTDAMAEDSANKTQLLSNQPNNTDTKQ